jgi:hypothetical protein
LKQSVLLLKKFNFKNERSFTSDFDIEGVLIMGKSILTEKKSRKKVFLQKYIERLKRK